MHTWSGGHCCCFLPSFSSLCGRWCCCCRCRLVRGRGRDYCHCLLLLPLLILRVAAQAELVQLLLVGSHGSKVAGCFVLCVGRVKEGGHEGCEAS